MPETPDYALMKQVPLFAELTEEEIYRVARLAFIKAYRKDATLFLEGMPGEVMYVVLKGSVHIVKKTPQGELTLATLGPGNFLGEMSLIDDSLRSASARTAEDAEMLVITKKCFKDMLNTDPKITSKLMMHLLRVMSGRLRQTDKKFEK